MLGHKLVQTFDEDQAIEVWAAARVPYEYVAPYGFYPKGRYLGGLAIQSESAIRGLLSRCSPDIVVNAVGIVKQVRADPVNMLLVNAVFPHQLERLCAERHIRLIHISTDCVFSGQKGGYTEQDIPDPLDMYGRSKLAGEPTGSTCLTIRTSIVGRQLRGTYGLVEWFLSSRDNSLRGYSRAIFSGLTTIELSKVIGSLVVEFPDLSGTFHVASVPISKYDLLVRMNDAYSMQRTIVPDSTVRIDRSLDASRLIDVTGLAIPTWPDMIQELVLDSAQYGLWRLSRDV